MNELPDKERLWQLTLHEDDVFNSRQNLFLVAESMLVVAYTTALGASNGHDSAIAVGVAGFLLTIFWLYAGVRHGLIVNSVQAKARARFPDYEHLLKQREWLFLPIRSREITVYAVPLLIVALWVVLLATQPGAAKTTGSCMHGSPQCFGCERPAATAQGWRECQCAEAPTGARSCRLRKGSGGLGLWRR